MESCTFHFRGFYSLSPEQQGKVNITGDLLLSFKLIVLDACRYLINELTQRVNTSGFKEMEKYVIILCHGSGIRMPCLLTTINLTHMLYSGV